MLEKVYEGGTLYIVYSAQNWLKPAEDKWRVNNGETWFMAVAPTRLISVVPVCFIFRTGTFTQKVKNFLFLAVVGCGRSRSVGYPS